MVTGIPRFDAPMPDNLSVDSLLFGGKQLCSAVWHLRIDANLIDSSVIFILMEKTDEEK